MCYGVKVIYVVVGFEWMVLIEDYFVWVFFGIGDYWFDYCIGCICGNCFGEIVWKFDVVICDDWYIISCFGIIVDCG